MNFAKKAALGCCLVSVVAFAQGGGTGSMGTGTGTTTGSGSGTTTGSGNKMGGTTGTTGGTMGGTTGGSMGGSMGTTGAATGAAAMMGQSASQLVAKDQKGFLQQVWHLNDHEMKLSELAQTKASSQQVKDYAKRMMTEHKAANDRMATMFKSQGVQMKEPKPANETQRKVQAAETAAMTKLQSLDGEVFDRAYMAHMIGDHDMAFTKLTMGQTQFTSNAELRPMLQELIGHITAHRQQAHDILGQLKPAAPSGIGGSGMGMDPSMHMGSGSGTGATGTGSTGSMGTGSTGSMGTGSGSTMQPSGTSGQRQ